MFCSTCGSEIVSSSLGRSKLYCSSDCRNYNKYKNALESIFLSLNADKSHTSVIRGDMFRLANILSNGTKTILKDGSKCK